jgi:Cu2+-exporting ATPase
MRKNENKEEPLPQNYQEAFFNVNGMHCATCESFIESLATRRDGIYKAEASYASEMLKIYYDSEHITLQDIPNELSKMGYRVSDVNNSDKQQDLNEVGRLVMGGFLGIIGLLLYSLFLYPGYISGQGFIPLTAAEQFFFISNIFVMTSFVLFYTGYPILRGAWVSISVFKPNMDLLVAIAAVSAYLYSFGALLSGSTEVYFDVTMAIVLVVSIGNYYEKRVKAGKQDLLTNLSEKKIEYARVQRNNHFEKVSISDIEPGDKILVKAGERIPIDGTVSEGEAVVNEALMTGESTPVKKKSGDPVVSGTVLTQHALTIEPGDEIQSTIDQLIKLMWNIQSSRGGKQRLADRIASYFVPAVLLLAAVTFGYHMFGNHSMTEAMLSSLAVLIVSCPCALGLATPLAIASGIKSGLENNIIFKTGALFEEKGTADVIAFDKTGTLTTGEMQLIDRGNNEKAVDYAARLEQLSSHPIAAPIANIDSNCEQSVSNFQSYSTGVSGIIGDKEVYVGEPSWLEEAGFHISAKLANRISRSRSQGHIPVGVAWQGNVQSLLIVGDQLRKDAADIIADIKDENIKTALITGDSAEASQSIQQQLNTDFLFNEIRPESKSNIVKELKKVGAVAMVGDGSNDAPALAEADIGIAFGNLTAIAADSAQVVIPAERLSLIPATFEVIRQTKSRIRQNLGWAFLYNIITIPLAIAGAINPLFAAVAMAASSLLVVTNSSRKMKIRYQ